MNMNTGLFEDLKRMIDISEEAERQEQEEVEREREKDEPAAAGVAVDTSYAEAMVKRAEAAVQKKNQEYQALLNETQALRAEYDEYKNKTTKELKAAKRSLVQERQGAAELRKAAEAGGDVDKVFISGLERQIEELRERCKAAEAEATRQERRCVQGEHARERLESETKATIQAMNTRMEAWKERAEANQQKAQQELQELRTRLGRGSPLPTASSTSLTSPSSPAQPRDGSGDEVGDPERVTKLEAELSEAAQELEKAHWEMMQGEQKANELRQALQDREATIRSLEEALQRKQGETDEQAAVLEARVQALEQQLSARDAEAKSAKCTENEEQQLRQREVHELQRKADDLQTKVTTVTRLFEEEKETVRQLMAHLESSREENSRKDQAYSDLYNDGVDATARLRTFESQASVNTQLLMEKDEQLEAAAVEKMELQLRGEVLAKDLQAAREAARAAESQAASVARDLRKEEQAVKELQFECQQAKNELQHAASDENAKEAEVAHLRQRLLDTDKKVTEILRAKDEMQTRARQAEAKLAEVSSSSSSRRSKSIPGGIRSSSPSVADILQAAADGGRRLSQHPPNPLRTPLSWTALRPIFMVFIVIFFITTFYYAQWTSGVVGSSEQHDLHKSIIHLRSVLSSQERALATCRATCVPVT